MRTCLLALAVAAAIGAPDVARAQFPTPPGGAASPAPESTRVLQLSFDPDGRVSLSAKGVTIREILAEWARQCGCYVVNGDKMAGGPLEIPLLYEHETQAAVLESLLRQAAGFVLTPQRAGVTSKSAFETIYIVATSSPSASSYAPPPATPSYGISTPGAPDDEIAPVTPVVPGAAQQPTAPPTPTSSAPLPPGMVPSTYPSTSTPAPPPPGTPGTFVPIVPVTAGPPQPQAGAPGTVTPTPSATPPPIPLPQVGR